MGRGGRGRRRGGRGVGRGRGGGTGEELAGRKGRGKEGRQRRKEG